MAPGGPGGIARLLAILEAHARGTVPVALLSGILVAIPSVLAAPGDAGASAGAAAASSIGRGAVETYPAGQGPARSDRLRARPPCRAPSPSGSSSRSSAVTRNLLPKHGHHPGQVERSRSSQVTGFWQGMSGSPLYIDDKLACALLVRLSLQQGRDRRMHADRVHEARRLRGPAQPRRASRAAVTSSAPAPRGAGRPRSSAEGRRHAAGLAAAHAGGRRRRARWTALGPPRRRWLLSPRCRRSGPPGRAARRSTASAA